MKLIEISVCLAQGHIWGDSRRAPGWQTCRRCLMRRRDPWAAPAQREAAVDEPAPEPQSALRTIVVAARKGGAGKTTLAVQLALSAYLRGRMTVLADADPQRSATEAMLGRVGPGPLRAEAFRLGVATIHERAETMRAERLVIDTPGGAGPTLAEAMSLADLVLLVAQPTFLDIVAAVRTFAEARALDVPSLIVINRAPPARAGQEHASVAKALEALRVTNLPVAATIVHARTAFQASIASGRSVEELGPSPAADEIAALWSAVEARLAEAPQADAAPKPATQRAQPAPQAAV
jgi:chromosome partitioning protein